MPDDSFVTESIYPNQDELGRIICKSCGLPYDSWRIRELVEKGLARQNSLDKQQNDDILEDQMNDELDDILDDHIFASTCLKCENISAFAEEDLFNYTYDPISPGNFSKIFVDNPGSIIDKYGYLKCKSCNVPFEGFSIRGTLILLSYSGQSKVWLACTKCTNTSSYLAAELTQSLPDTPINILQPGESISGYVIRSTILGGMGVVYICNLNNGFIVAKTLKPELSLIPEIEDRFRREAKAWILLNRHPNIVQAIQIAIYKGQSVLLIAFQKGGNLAERMHKHPLTLMESVKYGIDFCKGMEHARSVIPGFVHRDVKPENCLIGEDGKLKISDFGLVKIREELDKPTSGFEDEEEKPMDSINYQTKFGRSGMGTLPYMAPEQFYEFSTADVRSDIYSFGVMLFQMLTGRLPVTANRKRNFEDWHNAHQYSPIQFPSDNHDKIPPELSQLVFCCLAKISKDRPENFGEVLKSLASIQEIYFNKNKKIETSLKEKNKSEEQLSLESIEQIDFYRPFNLVKIGKPLMALDYINNVLTLLSNNSELIAVEKLAKWHAIRSAVLRTLDRIQDAKEAAGLALSINPKDPMALYEIGIIALNTKDFQTALRFLKQSYMLDPERPRLQFDLAFVYNATGNYSLAITLLKDEIKKAPEDYINYREIGYSYLQIKELDLSLLHYESALTFCPNDLKSERAEIANNIGAIYNIKGDKELYNKWVKMAWFLAPKGSNIYNLLSSYFKKDN